MTSIDDFLIESPPSIEEFDSKYELLKNEMNKLYPKSLENIKGSHHWTRPNGRVQWCGNIHNILRGIIILLLTIIVLVCFYNIFIKLLTRCRN